jgi:penicillin-insensitive murein endopeptidase
MVTRLPLLFALSLLLAAGSFARAEPVAPTAPAAAKTAPQATAPATTTEESARAVINPPLPQKRPVISEMTIPAKALFARAKLPSIGKSQAIGYYPRGCLQGGIELPIDGPNWQVMRDARNRNWGHPELIKFLKRFAPRAAKAAGWPGILIGDMAQPRGGPLPYGHTSHQVGLDVDIWLTPMPGHQLTEQQRNSMPPLVLVAPDRMHVNPKTWTPADAAFIRTAAEQPEVERIFVNAAIKKELCRLEGKHHFAWMDKVRPWYGHADHMHVRLKCPADSPHCRHQPPVPDSDDCSAKALAYWFSDRVLHPKPSKKPAKPHKAITLADLPAACKTVLDAPAKHTDLTAIER